MTYEYVCTTCQHVWEAEQSISAAPLKVCPNCQNETAKRQVSGGAGFILKGGGWYSDLYSSSPKKSGDSGSESSSSSKSSESKSTSSTSTSSDSSSSSSSSAGGSKGTPSGSKGGADSSAA